MNVKIEQIKQVYSRAPLGIAGQAIVLFIITLFLLGHVPRSALALWSALSFLLLLIRAASIYLLKPHFQIESIKHKIRQWFVFYRFLIFLSSLLWGSSVYFIPFYQQVDLHFFLLATIFAISGAALSTLGSIFSIYITFTLPMFFIIIISLLVTNELAMIEAALLTIVGAFFLIFTAYNDSRNTYHLFIGRYLRNISLYFMQLPTILSLY